MTSLSIVLADLNERLNVVLERLENHQYGIHFQFFDRTNWVRLEFYVSHEMMADLRDDLFNMFVEIIRVQRQKLKQEGLIPDENRADGDW